VLAVAAVAAIAVVALGGTALAGHIGSGVKSYTGCLVTSSGTFVKVKEGDQPQAACSSGQVLVHLSGGDITSVSAQAGGGLAGGNTEGAAALSIRRDCGSGDIVKWNGTAWACAADSNSTYAAGEGLQLTGSTFSIHPDYRLPNKVCSTAGQFSRGFDDDGEIQCAAPASAGVEVWHKLRPPVTEGTVIVLPEDEGVDLITMPLPAGTFLVTAVAEVKGRSNDELSLDCLLRDGAFNGLPVQHGGLNITDGAIGDVGAMVTIHGVLSLTSADTVRFTCFSGAGDGEAEAATMTAVKVATVHTP
jgi:hypothetical protein